MAKRKELNKIGQSISDLRHENSQLQISLRQAEERCLSLQRKNIEYIYHLGIFKNKIWNRIENYILNLLGKNPNNKEINDTNEDFEKTNYSNWINKNELLSDVDYEKIQKHIDGFDKYIKFTIILILEKQELLHLEKTLQSIFSQIYTNYEIIISGESDHIDELRTKLVIPLEVKDNIQFRAHEYPFKLKKILMDARARMSGDFVSVLKVGSTLSETAFYELAFEINNYSQLQSIYCDEDIINEDGSRSHPFFKPDWNLEYYLGINYVGDFCVLERSIFDYSCNNLSDTEDLEALNFRALTSRERQSIRHIPALLYHKHINQNDLSWLNRSVSLVNEYISEQKLAGEAAQFIKEPQCCQIRWEFALPEPLVTIIIPTRNRPDLLGPCLQGVLSETNYKNIEVIIIDHENNNPKVVNIFRKYLNDDRLIIMPYSGVFDHSQMNNFAAELANGEILLFLNDDIEVIEGDWLSHIVAQFSQEDRGVVGARLLYPNRTIQHAGVILGFGGVAGHGHVGLEANDFGYYGRLTVSSEVAALTGACMAIKRSLFEEIGGFSATHLKRTFNDVDLCLKAASKSKVNIYTPLATLIHHESATGGSDVKLSDFQRLQEEVGYMLDTWGLMQNDPHYNVNLALETKSFALAQETRRIKPWDIQ